MVEAIAIPAILIALYALWVVSQIDRLRLIQGVYRTRGKVVRHISSDEGFVAIYAFDHGGIAKEVPAKVGHVSPTPPVGTATELSYPKRRPDLARPPEVFGRSLMYGCFAAWIAFFSDLWLGWF